MSDRNTKEQTVELMFNSEIKNYVDILPEPFRTYLSRVKKWEAMHPPANIEEFSAPKHVINHINNIRMRMMQLKIGGLKEEYGFSSGVKFKLSTVIQAIASGKGLSSKDRPFLRLTSDIKHSVTLLVDFSTSMLKYIDEIKQSVYVFAEVLSKLQLSFGVYGYSNYLWIIKDFSEKWDLKSKSRLFGLEAKGMGPESIAINVAGIMTQRKIEKGKVMFVLTDGIFENRLQVRSVVQSLRKCGILVIGISLFADISDVFSINIRNIEDLNEIWCHDTLMRIYSREFHSDY
ncbi:MAG: hypothetical protein GF364_10295 [Candidatus Lokiarchaeota archaeon]|nr:hypothetical protein [Candidatus Lokiarchaeota archaeon]